MVGSFYALRYIVSQLLAASKVFNVSTLALLGSGFTAFFDLLTPGI
jgi:hypothetical protein